MNVSRKSALIGSWLCLAMLAAGSLPVIQPDAMPIWITMPLIFIGANGVLFGFTYCKFFFTADPDGEGQSPQAVDAAHIKPGREV